MTGDLGGKPSSRPDEVHPQSSASGPPVRLGGDPPSPPGDGPPVRLGGDPPSPWEGQFGYSRVVRAGPFVFVGGMTSVTEDGGIIGETSYDQTVEILRKVAHELARVELGLADVIQNRVYVTDISRGEEVGRAHGDAFAAHRPLMTMVQVAALLDPRMLVEIETVAYRS